MSITEIVVFVLLTVALWATGAALKQRDWFFAALFCLNSICFLAVIFAPGGAA